MAQRNKAALRALFETGDTPTGADFADMIDSSFNPSDDSFPAQRTDAEVVASVDAVIGNENWKTQYSHPASHSIDMINESATHVKMTTAERAKLTGVEANAKDDQTGSEIAALIDTELGAGDWRTGGQDTSLTSNPATITKTSAESFADLITKIQALGTKNYGGYSVNIQFGTGNHNIGASDIELLRGLFNGEMNWDAQVASAKGSAQTTTITTNAAGMILIKSLGINLNISHIKFIVGASGSNVVLSASGQGNITTYRCAYDVSSASAESTPIVVDGISFTSNEDTFIGSPSQVSNFIKSFGEGRGGEVNIFNAGFETNKFTNATSGLIKAAFSNSNLAFTNKVANGAVDVSANDGAGSVSVPAMTSGLVNNLAQTTGDFVSEFNRAGTIYWAVLPTASSVPDRNAIIAGTGATASGNVATVGMTTETESIAGLIADTAYKLYYFGRDVLNNDTPINLIPEFSTLAATPQLNAPVLTAGTPTSSSIPLTWTDTNTSPNERSLEIQWSADGSTGWTAEGTPVADATSYNPTVPASTQRYFRIRAVGNGVDELTSAWSNVVNETTQATSTSAWAQTIATDWRARNTHASSTHLDWGESVILAQMADGSYYETTFGAGGQDKTAADFFLIWKANGAIAGSTSFSKAGQDPRWNIGGATYNVDDLPTHTTTGDEHVILSSTDDLENQIINCYLKSNAFVGELPVITSSSITDFNLLNGLWTGSCPNFNLPACRLFDLSTGTLTIPPNSITLSQTENSSLRLFDQNFSGAFPTINAFGLSDIQAQGNSFNTMSPGIISNILTPTTNEINFRFNALNEDSVGIVISEMLTYYTANTPLSNMILNLSGGSNSTPSNQATSDLAALQAIYDASSYTLTATIN